MHPGTYFFSVYQKPKFINDSSFVRIILAKKEDNSFKYVKAIRQPSRNCNFIQTHIP